MDASSNSLARSINTQSVLSIWFWYSFIWISK